MTIVVTGAHGQLGREFVRQLGDRAVAFERSALDITDREQVRRTLGTLHPTAVVNCAAYTQVDKAEIEPQLCERINSQAVAHLAETCETVGCPLVQISTDYVFGGDASRSTPYRETEEPHPQSVYARTKLAGERHAEQCTRHFIVRTCGLYGESPERRNFVETMLRLGRERDRLRVVNDQHCTPTFVGDLVTAIRFLIGTDAYGTFHIVNQGATTWYDFACEIFRRAKIQVAVDPITSDQYAAPASRPRYSVLDTGKYLRLGGPALPSWQDALGDYLRDRLSRHESPVPGS